MYLLKEFEENPSEIWDTNIFGKSLHELVSEGLNNKLYRMPIDARNKFRETVELVCPNCHNKVNFGVFSNFERRLAVKPTLLDTQTVYFLVCPECASVYTVEEARGKAFQKGEKLSIGNFDLKSLKKFKSEV